MGKLNPEPLRYPCVPGDDYVLAAENSFSDELKDIIEKSGCKDKVKNMLKQRIRYLCEKRQDCFDHRQWFERIEGELHSLRIKHNQLNLRILFSFLPIKKTSHAVLLCAFLEKEGPTSNTQGYKPYVSIAKSRLSQLKEDISNE